MDQAFWHARWQANEIGFHQSEINAHLQRYWPHLKVPAGATVFVPLCGKSRDMLWLAGEGFKVLGNEISPIAVTAFFAENKLQPLRSQESRYTRVVSGEITLLEGDFFALQPQDLTGIAAVYDRASLIALPASMRLRYAQHMAWLIPTGVSSLLITLDYPQHEMDGPPFAVSATDVVELFSRDFHIVPFAATDILSENPRFQARGLSRLVEQAYRLERR